MAGIGDTLRAERRRQGRTLADAAAETRVRESYLAAIEDEDFAVLGGDVYARGFIKLYSQYLSLDPDRLVAQFRASHEARVEANPFPSSSIDDVLPPPSALRAQLSPPVLAALALVGILVVAFFFFRATGGEEAADEADPNAPGPSPAEVSALPEAEPTEDADQIIADTPADPLRAGPAAPASPGAEGPVLEELLIDVSVLRPVRMSVLQGQPPVSNATLQEGDLRQITDDQEVVFQVSDAGAVEVMVNGLPLVGLGGPGQAVQVSCAVGRAGCDVSVL